jgi:hypothetical protein
MSETRQASLPAKLVLRSFEKLYPTGQESGEETKPGFENRVLNPGDSQPD